VEESTDPDIKVPIHQSAGSQIESSYQQADISLAAIGVEHT